MAVASASSKNPIVEYFRAGNDVLYAPAESEKLKSYFQTLLKGKPFEVKRSATRGKGLYALKAFQPGDVIFTELGLFSIQAETNKRVAKVCAECFHYVGDSVADQVGHILARKLTTEETTELDANVKQHPNKPALRPEHNCDCGEIYCSEECKEKASSQYHKLLCPATRPEIAESLSEYYNHCDATNEIFRLCAKVYAYVALTIQERHVSLEEALYPIRMFAKEDWIKICSSAEEAEDDFEDYVVALQALVEDTTSMLKDVFGDAGKMIEPMFDPEFMSLLVGVFEMNNLSILVPHPIINCFPAIPESIKTQVVARTKELLKHVHSDDHGCCDDGCDSDHEHGDHGHDHKHGDEHEDECEEMDDEEAWDALMCEGTSLHSIQALMNHQNEPNATVFKSFMDPEDEDEDEEKRLEDEYVDGRTIVKAKLPIAIGDEITISYVDEDLEEDERDEALKEYGITKDTAAKLD